jgi:ribonuclease HI
MPDNTFMGERWILYFDGACEPVNPGGHATYGWQLFRPDGELYAEDNGHICSGPGATNNVAEFGALEAGLRFMVKERLFVPLLCKGDSQLVVHLMNGRWKAKKPHLQQATVRCGLLLNEINSFWDLEWIPRLQNDSCDQLSKTAKIPDRYLLQRR